jgi:hypothetical protein
MSKTIPLGRSLLITLFLAVGIAFAWCALGNWLNGIVDSAMQSREPFENIYLSTKGEPILVRSSAGNTSTTEQILSLAGDPLPLTSQDLLYPQAVGGPDKDELAARSLDWRSRLTAETDGGIPPIYWYMIHDGKQPGHAYGVGFHAPTQTIAGYFARKGFTKSLPPREEWFDIAGTAGLAGVTTARFHDQEPRWSGGSQGQLLLADGKLWKIDAAKKQLQVLLDCPKAYRVGHVWRILDAAPAPPSEEQAEDQRAVAIRRLRGILREPESLVVVNLHDGEQVRYPLPVDLREKNISSAVLPSGELLIIAHGSWRDTDYKLVWLKTSGEVVKQQTVRLKSRYPEPSWTWLGWQSALIFPLPIVNAAYTTVWAPLGSIQEEKSDDYREALTLVLQKTWPSVLAVLAIGCAAAVLAYRRQKRFGLPHAGAWAAFVFLLGIPGWLAYRFHRTWPVLEDCPSCRQASPRDRTTCLDCGASFPPPPLKGIEVFA